MSEELVLLSTSSTIALRADAVLEEIQSLKTSIMRGALRLGRLLREARDNDYHLAWGSPRFGDWVEEGSGLDMSARSAYDLIKVVEQAERLGITDDELERVKISKLKSIFTLKDGEMDDEGIRELVLTAETTTLEDIKEIVALAKNQQWVHKTYKYDKTAYDEVIVPATDRMRLEYGETMSEEGGSAIVSDSKVIELWAADYMAGAGPIEGDILEGDFEDEFELQTLSQSPQEIAA